MGVAGRTCFHVAPDAKMVKNRLHLNVHVSGGPSVLDGNVRQRADA
jgi:hypothetical protein